MAKLLPRALINSINATLALRDYSISRVRNILTREENGIYNAVFILMVLMLGTKFTGLVFNSMSAGFLGAGPYNEFLFASNIPEIISASILLGAISASIIPALVQSREEAGHGSFLRVFNTLVNISFIVFALLAGVVAIFADAFLPWAIDNLIHPVTPPTAEELDRIVTMLRVLMIPQVILGISTYISSSLNVMQRFVVPQLAPLFYNFGRILSILVFIPILGRSPWVLVWGTLLGSIFHLLIQIPLARNLGIKYMPILDFKDKYFKSLLKLGLPRILGLSAEQIAIGVDRIIAYGLVGYSLTAYELGVRLIVIPISLFGMTFATASFPLLSKAYVHGDTSTFQKIFIKVLNQIVFLSLPVTVLLLVLRLPITRLFYGIFGNHFTWDYTRLVAWVVMFFAVGLTFEALRSLLYRTYYAVHNSLIPLLSAIFVVVGGVITGILFTNYFSHFHELSVFDLEFNPEYFLTKSDGIAGVGGLALSGSLIYIVETLFLLLYLNHKYLKIKIKDFVLPLFKKFFISGMTLFLAYFLYTFYNDILDTSRTSQIFFLTTTTVVASMAFYFLLSYELKVEEVEIVDKMASKIYRTYKATVKLFKNSSTK